MLWLVLVVLYHMKNCTKGQSSREVECYWCRACHERMETIGMRSYRMEPSKQKLKQMACEQLGDRNRRKLQCPPSAKFSCLENKTCLWSCSPETYRRPRISLHGFPMLAGFQEAHMYLSSAWEPFNCSLCFKKATARQYVEVTKRNYLRFRSNEMRFWLLPPTCYPRVGSD